MFGKRNHEPRGAPEIRDEPSVLQSGLESFPVDFDMLLKGAVFERKSGKIRQVTVTVNGATRLVTSGDAVSRETIEALIASGAIHAPPGF